MTATRYEMSTRECVELLQGSSIGRMCVIEHGYPLATLRRAQPGHDLPDPRPLLEFNRSQWLAFHPSAWSGRRFVVESTADPLVVDWQMAAV